MCGLRTEYHGQTDDGTTDHAVHWCTSRAEWLKARLAETSAETGPWSASSRPADVPGRNDAA
jgi:hypothetical protein